MGHWPMSIGHVEACKRMRQILVPLSGQFDRDDPEALDVPALKTAFTLARSFDAHVEVFCMEAEIDRAHRHLSTRRAETQPGVRLPPW